MEAIAHGMKPRKGGPSVKVAKEFAAADAGRKFKSGGSVKKRKKAPRMPPAAMAAMAGPPPGGPPQGGPPMGMKSGGAVRGGGCAIKGVGRGRIV